MPNFLTYCKKHKFCICVLRIQQGQLFRRRFLIYILVSRKTAHF